jgi:SAM-dependent methyltransferase
MNVFGAYADDYDRFRPAYPAQMWDDVVAACGAAGDLAAAASSDDESAVHAVDIAAGTGRAAVELARRGFAVTAVDLDRGMLSTAEAAAKRDGLKMETRHAPAEDTGLVGGHARLITCMQAFHWFDVPRAVSELRRVVEDERGAVLIAWNDRDLRNAMMRELEDIFKEHNPLYDYTMKLAEHVTSEGEALTGSGAFSALPPPLWARDEGTDGSAHGGMWTYDNPTKGMDADALIDLCRTFSYVRNALDEKGVDAFEKDVRALVRRHHGSGTFALPWVTKCWVLRPR